MIEHQNDKQRRFLWQSVVNGVRPGTTPGSCAVRGGTNVRDECRSAYRGRVRRARGIQNAHRNWYDIKPSWARLNQLIEVRNAIAHGLGKLTRVQRAKRASAATQIALVNVRLSGDRIVLEEADLQNVKDACADLISEVDASAREDRIYAQNLATIRKAAELTQDDLAQRLGIDQSVVSKTERREDMLLSTLMDYLSAAGVEDAKMVVHVNGREIELDLRSLQHQVRG